MNGSYTSDAGDRYVTFYSLGNKGVLAVLVFVAADSATYNRLSIQANTFFNGLSPTDEAAGIAAAARPAPQSAPSSSASSSGGDLRSRIIGVWSTFQPPGNTTVISRAIIDKAGFGSWYHFRDDGTFRVVRAIPQGGLSWRGSAEDGRWSLNGNVMITKVIASGGLDDPRPPEERGKSSWFPPQTYTVGFSPEGDLLLQGSVVSLKLPRAK